MKKTLIQYSNRKNLIKDYYRFCDSKYRLEHHRINKTGPYTKDNVICLCKRCHSLVHHNKRLFELMKILKIVEIMNG